MRVGTRCTGRCAGRCGDAAAHGQEVAQGRGTGGDSGAAGSRGRRGEPRVTTGAASGGRSCVRGAGSGGAARETARGYRERHTPRRAEPHGALPRRPLHPRGGGAGQGELGGAGVAPPGCRRGPGGPGAAPVWPRYLPAPRRSPAPSWSGGGSGAARGRPPPATGPQRGRGGRGGGGPGAEERPEVGGKAVSAWDFSSALPRLSPEYLPALGGGSGLLGCPGAGPVGESGCFPPGMRDSGCG